MWQCSHDRCMFERNGAPRPGKALHAQAAIALSNEQVEQVCDAYEAMLAALERATAEQDAILARRALHPGAAWIAQNVRDVPKKRARTPSHQVIETLSFRTCLPRADIVRTSVG